MIVEQKPNKLKRILFLVLGVIIAGVAVAVIAIQLGQKEPDASVEATGFHQTAEDGVSFVVNFALPETTDEEYALLYSVCEQNMETYGAPELQTPVVDVTEDTFIDAEVRPLPSEMPEPDVYTEYDRTYFEDFLMIRYVSHSGDICVVGARLMGEDRTETEFLSQDAFSGEHFSASADEEEKKGWLFRFDSKQKMEEEIQDIGAVSEETFVSCVGQCILDILSKTEDEERVLSHFTEEGEASLLRIAQVLEIGSDCSPGIVLAEVGMSDPELGTMDRMYLRCELLQGAETTYLDLLVKLNSDCVIYDVDTV